MKILVFHQPFPMGNYRINNIIANRLSKHHDVYLLQQLNGALATDEYINMIKAESFDAVYFEMLDAETFKVVEQLSARRILLIASKGVFKSFDDVLQYKGKYFDVVMTNSEQIHKLFTRNNVPAVLFHYYCSAIRPDECIYDTRFVYDNVFLGMGFGRQFRPEYALERDVFFNSPKKFSFAIFGNGWEHQYARGVLGPDDIGRLYSSAKSGLAIIEKVQREHNSINNRYTELAFCKCPIVTYPYNIDWYGADKFMNFVSTADEYSDMVNDIVNNPERYTESAEHLHSFILNQDIIFFETLNSILS